MPLVIIANTYGDGSGESVMSHVTTLLVDAVSTGTFTTSIQQFAARRRLAAEVPSELGAAVAWRRQLSMTSAAATSSAA